MQHGRRGLIPVRSKAVKDENGIACTSPKAQYQRWRQHFSRVLNLHSQFDESELEKAKQRPMKNEMSCLPSLEDLCEAITRLKNGKAAGSSGILPEMIKVACEREEFLEVLLDLVHEVWKESKVPSDWTNAILIPIPKKGDLSSCDNWRGISLLDVVGKLVASILQRRLQVLAEEVLTESQCGFRRGRSCSDMVFTMRQLVEKSWEHSAKLFVTFIDLQKAYDSVPRNAMWMALRKLGVPDSIVSLIGSFHQGMTATIQLDGEILKEINVENGLRQGCCMAPVLFNLYTCLLMERWYARTVESDGLGIALWFKYDEKLFRRYTRNADERKLTECLFAEDGTLLATSQDGAQKAIKEYMAVSRSFGLTVSISKTKHMATGRALSNVEKAPISVSINETISVVEEFKYLGSVIGASGNMDGDIQNRLAQARCTYIQL